MPHRKTKPAANGGVRSVAFWHRWLSLLIILPLLPIAVTGIVLNHVDNLGLDRHYVEHAWLLDWYDIDLAPPETGYRVEGRWITGYEGALWLDANRIGDTETALVGATASDDLLAAATHESLWLLLPGGEVVDRLRLQQLPGPPQALSQADGKLLLRTGSGQFQSDNAGLNWQPTTQAWPESARTQALPPAVAAEIQRQAERQSLTWEQVVLDLHSGNALGGLGVLIADLVALMLVVLALTGSWLWLLRLRGQRARKAFLRNLPKR